MIEQNLKAEKALIAKQIHNRIKLIVTISYGTKLKLLDLGNQTRYIVNFLIKK